VSIRSLQEQAPLESIRWVPTQYQFSDGLTKVDAKLRENFSRWLKDPVCITTQEAIEHASAKEKYTGESSVLSDSFTVGTCMSTEFIP